MQATNTPCHSQHRMEHSQQRVTTLSSGGGAGVKSDNGQNTHHLGALRYLSATTMHPRLVGISRCDIVIDTQPHAAQRQCYQGAWRQRGGREVCTASAKPEPGCTDGKPRRHRRLPKRDATSCVGCGPQSDPFCKFSRLAIFVGRVLLMSLRGRGCGHSDAQHRGCQRQKRSDVTDAHSCLESHSGKLEGH